MMPMPSQKDKQLLIRRALIKENSNKHVTEPQVGVALGNLDVFAILDVGGVCIFELFCLVIILLILC